MNTIENTWEDKVRGATRRVRVQVESTRPLTDDEYDLLRRIDRVATDYLSARPQSDGDDS